MKNIFTLLLLLSVSFIATAQWVVHYSFDESTCTSSTVTDLSGNGYNGTLYGGAKCAYNGRLYIEYSDSNYLSVPPEVLDGLGDFTLRLRVNFRHINDGSPSSMNTVFSTSHAGCINCFGLSYQHKDFINDQWLFYFNGTLYNFDGYAGSHEIIIERENDSLFVFDGFTTSNLKLTIIDSTPLDVETFIVGQKEHCLGGCFKVKQCLYGGVNDLKVWDHKVFKQSDLEGSEADLEVFPNPSSSAFQLNYTLSASSPLTITDLYGRIVKQLLLDPSSTNITISTDDLADGVYLITLADGDLSAGGYGKIISKKVVIAR